MEQSGLVFAGVGVALMAVALPLMLRRVRPNRIYGLRVPATFADEWVWYQANAKSGRDLFVLGVLLAVVAVALGPLTGASAATTAAVCGVVAVGGVLILAAVGWSRAHRLLRQRRSGGTGRP